MNGDGRFLMGLAPTAVEQCLSRRNPRRWRGVFLLHYPGKNFDRAIGV
jgi:hypothetical protein